MKSFLIVCMAVCLVAGAFAADETSAKPSKAEDRLKAAADVLNEIQSAPDQGIPEEVLGSAECVSVVPSMLKGGFIVGARYGRGVASCRTLGPLQHLPDRNDRRTAEGLSIPKHIGEVGEGRGR